MDLGPTDLVPAPTNRVLSKDPRCLVQGRGD